MEIAPGFVQQETIRDGDKYVCRDCGGINHKGSTGLSEMALPANTFTVIEIAWLETNKPSRSRSWDGRNVHLEWEDFHEHCQFNSIDRVS